MQEMIGNHLSQAIAVSKKPQTLQKRNSLQSSMSAKDFKQAMLASSDPNTGASAHQSHYTSQPPADQCIEFTISNLPAEIVPATLRKIAGTKNVLSAQVCPDGTGKIKMTQSTQTASEVKFNLKRLGYEAKVIEQ